MNAEHERNVDLLINKTLHQSQGRIKRYYYYSLIPLGIGVIWLVFSFSQVMSLNNKVNSLTDSIVLAKMELKKYRDSAKSEKQTYELLKYLNDSLQVEYLRYLRGGKGVPAAYNNLEQSIRANDYLKSYNNKINRALNIWYFQKNIDAERVRLALGELGYSNIRVTPTGNTFLTSGETNSVAFSNDVKLEDLRVILLTLIRAGFKMEYVYPSERNRDLPGLIQIIRTVAYKDGKLVTRAPITVEQIVNARSREELVTN